MKTIFRCSTIKNVNLKDNTDILELEVAYVDVQDASWIKRRYISDYSDGTDDKEEFEKEYNKIKDALFNGKEFVEIEL